MKKKSEIIVRIVNSNIQLSRMCFDKEIPLTQMDQLSSFDATSLIKNILIYQGFYFYLEDSYTSYSLQQEVQL